MATSTFPSMTGAVDNTSAATFIPEIWSDEVIAAYEKNLVLAPLVKKLSMQGKKGDTIHIPKPTRGTANAKVENQAVTIQNATESEVIVTIDQHFEYSRLIEDITEAQALASLRQFYTGDAGYALAKNVDDALFALGKSFGDGDGSDWTNSNVFELGTGGALATYDGTVSANEFSDVTMRELVQAMDDADVPMDGRSFVIPPVLRNAILGNTRYTSSDFVGGRAVNNGEIGNIYGVNVYVTSNCPSLESGAARAALMFHKDTMVLAEQKGVRSQTQYKQEFLGTLYTADRLYGTKVVRPETGFAVVVGA